MHRKSAYFLFLAVLGDAGHRHRHAFQHERVREGQPRRRLFFRQAPAGLAWSRHSAVCTVGGAGRLPFLAADLVDLVRPCPHRARLFVSCRISGCASTVHAAGWRLGPSTFQPSEIAKIAVVFFLACWFAAREKGSGPARPGFSSFRSGLSPALSLLIVFEVDLGTTALIGATMFVIMFIAGTQSGAARVARVRGVGAILFVATHMSERMGRAGRFHGSGQRYKEDAGLQQMQALIAWGSGGIEGLGLGNGRQKMLYLPYAHTDFIFPDDRRGARSARQPARRVSVRRHHRLRNDDRAARERPRGIAPRAAGSSRCSACRPL